MRRVCRSNKLITWMGTFIAAGRIQTGRSNIDPRLDHQPRFTIIIEMRIHRPPVVVASTKAMYMDFLLQQEEFHSSWAEAAAFNNQYLAVAQLSPRRIMSSGNFNATWRCFYRSAPSNGHVEPRKHHLVTHIF